MLSTLFVYGTLRAGQSNAKMLDGLGHYSGAAAMRGTLYRIAAYPGLVDGDAEVRGELFELAAPERSLAVLDAFEGEDYGRVEREAIRPDGSRIRAWVYLYRGETGGKAVIVSGDWTAP